MRTSLLTLLCLLAVTACSSIEDLTGNNPIIDSQGVNLAQYNADVRQCEAYAEQVAIAQKAGAGAVSGAVVGRRIWRGCREQRYGEKGSRYRRRRRWCKRSRPGDS